MTWPTYVAHDRPGLAAELRASNDASVLAREEARDRQRGRRPEAAQPQEARPAEVVAAPAHPSRRHPRWHEMGLSDLDTY